MSLCSVAARCGPAAALLAWAGWAFAVYRSLRGEWRQHLILVAWTGVYFLWQSTSFTPSMRYMLPVYPTLVLLGAWFLWQLWFRAADVSGRWRRPARIASAAMLVTVVALSPAQAFAFLSIYTQPMTRVAASRWIYGNLPGPANLSLQEGSASSQEPIPLPLDFVLTDAQPFDSTFTSKVNGTVDAVTLTHVTDLTSATDASGALELTRLPERPPPSPRRDRDSTPAGIARCEPLLD